jgi:predicted metal-dependent hydrolase
LGIRENYFSFVRTVNKILYIEIGEQRVPVHLERTRGRSIRLLHRADSGSFTLRTPSGELTPQARDFVLSKKSWMAKHLHNGVQKDQRAIRFFEELEQGKLPFMGDTFQLKRLPGPRDQFSYHPEEKTINLLLRSPEANWQAYLREGLKLLAKKILPERTYKLAQATGSSINRVYVKGQKTRWGSCSSKTNINLNWHLIFLEEALIDYVIIHELMHLREMNHSPKFWSWVQHYYPNYKQAEKRIRQQEWMIGILGK